MHQSEWLNDAKRVPVGQHRRVYHGAERRPNLVVWNNEDSWSCYCHSCHEGGKVYKETLQKVTETAPVYRKYLNLADCCSLTTLSQKHPDKFKRMILLLHEKGMSTALFKSCVVMYNLVDERLVFRFQGVDIGRDCTGRSHAKWLVYHSDNPMEYVYLRGQKSHYTPEPVIMTEDLFSALKVRAYTGFSTMHILGTRIGDEIVRFFTQYVGSASTRNDQQERCRFVGVTAFDGDSAGYSATRSAHGRFSIRDLVLEQA